MTLHDHAGIPVGRARPKNHHLGLDLDMQRGSAVVAPEQCCTRPVWLLSNGRLFGEKEPKKRESNDGDGPEDDRDSLILQYKSHRRTGALSERGRVSSLRVLWPPEHGGRKKSAK